MKKFISFMLAFCLIIPCLFLFAACNNNNEASSEMTLSINPEVSFILDANDKVLSIKCENEDASVLYADINFVGKDVDSAIQIFIERAAITGHVDLNGDEITLDINGKSSVDVEALKAKAKAKIEQVFQNLGVNIEVKVQNLTVEAQKEALKVKAKVLAPEKTMQELYSMSNEELLKLINDKQKELKDLTFEQIENVNDLYSSAKNTLLKTIESLRTNIEELEEQINDLENKYNDQIPVTIQVQIDGLKSQIEQIKKLINSNLEEFLNNRKEEINRAQAEAENLKQQLKTEFKTQIETSKANVINHLTTSKNNGTITQEQYDYWVSLINNQSK